MVSPNSIGSLWEFAMLYLPPHYRQSKFLSNLGHFHGLKSLNGQKSTVADIASRLSPLPRSKVLAWLCALSGFVSEPTNKQPQTQLRLSAQLLSTEMHDAYQQLVRKEQNEIGGPGGLFHLQQVWFMVQMAVICCKEDAADVSEVDLKATLAITSLMANDIIQEIDTAIRSEPPGDDNFDEWCVGGFLPLSEVYSDDDILPRSHRLWFECARSEHVRKKAIEQGIEADIETAFANKHHVALREFFLFLVALRVHFQASRLRDPTKPHLWDTTEYLTRIFDAEFSTAALPLVSQKPEKLAIRLLANRQSWSSDISPLRENPLIQVGVRQRVAATVGAQSGRAGNRRQRESRDRAPHAQKSGLTNRKIASWAKKSILPPDADAGPRGCPRGPPGRSLGDRRNTRPACGKASGQPPACPVFHGIYGPARR